QVSLVDGVLQSLAGLELRLSRRLDRHRLAGSRIAACRSLALGHRECAETDQPHFVSARKRTGDGVKHTLDCLGSVAPRKSARIRNGSDQFVLVHGSRYPLMNGMFDHGV